MNSLVMRSLPVKFYFILNIVWPLVSDFMFKYKNTIHKYTYVIVTYMFSYFSCILLHIFLFLFGSNRMYVLR